MCYRKENLMKNMMTQAGLAWRNGIKYIPLLKNLISRELKKKYRTSVLGYAWCVLNPLLMMLIMTVVFSRMFANSIQNFPVYMFCGRMVYSFVTGGAGDIMRSLQSNGSLMRKTRVPYYIFPLANFSTAFVDLLFTLVAFALVLLFTGTPVSFHVIAFPVVIMQMALFTLGLGLILAIANVFIRDTHYLYAVFNVGWMYLTPLFYPLEALSESMQFIIRTFNPLYGLIAQVRAIFLDHAWPAGDLVLGGFAWGVVFLGIGLVVYTRTKNNLILYV